MHLCIFSIYSMIKQCIATTAHHAASPVSILNCRPRPETECDNLSVFTLEGDNTIQPIRIEQENESEG